MATRIKFRRGTAASWTAANPVLAQGEPGFETDAGAYKIGDGSSPWAALPYAYIPAKGGLDHGASATERRPLNMASPDVESGASVQALDLRGTPLAIYSTATGTTNGTTVTADSLGRIPGFVVAPDFDLKVTRANASVYYEKVRTSSPGVFHVNSYGAVPNPVTVPTAALIANFTDSLPAIKATASAADTARIWGGRLVFDAGSYVWDTRGGSATFPDNHEWVGAGRLATVHYLHPSGNAPFIDTRAQTSAAALPRINMRGMGFFVTNGSSHTNGFYFLELTGYFHDISDITFSGVPGGGIHFGLKTGATEGGTDSSDYLRLKNCILSGSTTSTIGILVDGGASNLHIFGGAFTDFDIAVKYAKALTAQQSNISLRGVHFEKIRGYSYWSAGGTCAVLDSNRLDGSVFLDDRSHLNRIQNNRFSEIADTGLASPMVHHGGGFRNVIGPNMGVDDWPFSDKPLEELYPGSRTRDPDMLSISIAGWTAGGSASPTKNVNLAASVRQYTRNSSQPLVVAGPTGKSVTQVVSGLAVGDTYLFESWWWTNVITGGGGAIGTMQWQLLDNATSTVLYDSGALARVEQELSEWQDDFVRTVIQLPTGVTDLAIKAIDSSGGSGATFYITRVELIRSLLANGGFQTATAGVADGWTHVGTGTPTQETGLVAHGQKIAVAATQTSIVYQTPANLDHSSHYLLRGRVKQLTGSRRRVGLGWGSASGLGSSANYYRMSWARAIGDWETLNLIFRPGAFTNAVMGIRSDATEAASAVFDDVHLIPLKRSVNDQTYWTDEIDLTVASRNYVLLAAPVDRDLQIRDCWITWTAAASAQGPQIRLGTVGNATTYTSFTPAATQAVGDTVVIPNSTAHLSRTEVRSGAPFIVTHAGATVNGGRIKVFVRADPM